MAFSEADLETRVWAQVIYWEVIPESTGGSSNGRQWREGHGVKGHIKRFPSEQLVATPLGH